MSLRQEFEKESNGYFSSKSLIPSVEYVEWLEKRIEELEGADKPIEPAGSPESHEGIAEDLEREDGLTKP
jgi:hypothetical protein